LLSGFFYFVKRVFDGKRKLYVVATPIGNLADITFRAVETLKLVHFIICEDTRVTKILLDHYQINKPLFVVNAHNESKVLKKF